MPGVWSESPRKGKPRGRAVTGEGWAGEVRCAVVLAVRRRARFCHGVPRWPQGSLSSGRAREGDTSRQAGRLVYRRWKGTYTMQERSPSVSSQTSSQVR